MGDKFLVGEAVVGLINNFAREVEDFLGATVVLDERHDVSVVVSLIIREVGGVGTLEFVNSLVVIAHGHNHWLFVVGKLLYDLELGLVSILKLVK